MEAKCGCAVPDGYPHECDGRRSRGPRRAADGVVTMLPQVRRVWGFDVDKSIDDQLIREARKDGASRERLRIIEKIIEPEYRYWKNAPHEYPGDFMLASGAMGALANVLCRIKGLLAAERTNAGE